MHITAIQWNIGAGLVREDTAEAEKRPVYSTEDLPHVARTIVDNQADIVTLQEVHIGNGSDQVDLLSKLTGLPHFVSHVYADSHLSPGTGLGQGILSRFPLTDACFDLFLNPGFTMVEDDGATHLSHDKGVTQATLQVPGGQLLEVETLHMIPYRKFGVDPLGEACRQLRDDLTKKIAPRHNPFLIQGDFNYNGETVREFLPGIFTPSTEEVPLDGPTTPRRRKYDRVLYSGLDLLESRILTNVRTDHFALLTRFEAC